MKVTIEKDDGEIEVFQNVTDLYIALRQLKPIKEKNSEPALLPETRSYSWGSNLRELVKEITQSVIELQNFLRGSTNGSSS